MLNSYAVMLMVLSLFLLMPSKPAEQTSSPLIGRWKVVKSQGDEGSDPGTFEFFKDGRILISQKNSDPREGSYVTDETKSPATIVLKIAVVESGTKKKSTIDCAGIYKFEGN